MSKKINYDRLVKHVAIAAKGVYDVLVRHPEYKKRATFLGRDASPVRQGVEVIDRLNDNKLDVSGFDISSKLFIYNWHDYEPRSIGKGRFITRLNNGEVTHEEIKNSLFWQYLQQNDYIKDGEITLVDNGINGTLLNRLNKVMHIADPDLVINNIMLYYSGAIHVDNLRVVIEDARDYMQLGLPSNKQGMDFFMKCAEQGRRNAELEGWPHPHPSASHFYLENGVIKTGYIPDSLEKFTDWEANIPVNERLLKRLEKILIKQDMEERK